MMKYLFFLWSYFFIYFVKIKNGISIGFTSNKCNIATSCAKIDCETDLDNLMDEYSANVRTVFDAHTPIKRKSVCKNNLQNHSMTIKFITKKH